jgi:hypothetical protein
MAALHPEHAPPRNSYQARIAEIQRLKRTSPQLRLRTIFFHLM